jgi:hypothetical protein
MKRRSAQSWKGLLEGAIGQLGDDCKSIFRHDFWLFLEIREIDSWKSGILAIVAACGRNASSEAELMET